MGGRSGTSERPDGPHASGASCEHTCANPSVGDGLDSGAALMRGGARRLAVGEWSVCHGACVYAKYCKDRP